MECKYCGAELDEGSSVCPACGQENGTAEKKKTMGKVIIAVVAAVVLLAVLAVVVITGSDGGTTAGGSETDSTDTSTEATVAQDGNPDDFTCKGSYTGTEEEIIKERDTVVAEMGDHQLTNGLLQVYYWNMFYNGCSNYVNNYGMDISVPLDSQRSPNEDTWQQAILSMAVENWKTDAAMTAMAVTNNLQLDPEAQEELDGLEESLKAQAEENGFVSADEMIQSSLGKGCTLEDYLEYARLYYYASAYYAGEVEKITMTEEDKENFYQENLELFQEQKIDKTTRWINVRHILLQPENCTFDEHNYVVADEEQWEACRAEAQKVLDDWLAHDGTEDGFGELAKELTADGNGEQGGLYEKVSQGQMVTAFDDWCFDESRVYGDSGLVKTEFGYHIMFFAGSEYVWEYYAEQNVLSQKKNEIYSSASGEEEMKVEYAKIVLGDVNYLSAQS